MCRFSRTKHVRSRRGAALLEFSLVALMLIFLVLGIVDFGLLLKDYIALNQVAREAVRTVSVGGEPNITDLATKCGLSATLATPNIDYGESSGDQISVSLTGTHQMLTGLFGSDKAISTSMVMRKE